MRIKLYRYMANYMNRRTGEIADDVTVNNKVYRELALKLITILDVIKDALPTEYEKLLDELEDIQVQSELIVHKSLYRQGLKDGIRLCVLFDMLK